MFETLLFTGFILFFLFVIVQWVSLCEAFLIEAEWFASGKVPRAEEYLKNGIVSSGVHTAIIHIFFLLGQSITKESVHEIDNSPTIISSTATILRLWDDLGSAEVNTINSLFPQINLLQKTPFFWVGELK